MSIFITTSIYTQLLTFAFEVAEMTTYIYGQHTLLLLLPASIQAEARESWELFFCQSKFTWLGYCIQQKGFVMHSETWCGGVMLCDCVYCAVRTYVHNRRSFCVRLLLLLVVHVYAAYPCTRLGREDFDLMWGGVYA